MLLEETLSKALQKTLYYHRVESLRSAENELERNAKAMFNQQSYDVMLAIFSVDLGRFSEADDDDDRKVALILAAIAAALAARLDNDVATLRPGLISALTSAIVNSGMAKYGIYADLGSIRAQEYLLQHGAELVAGINAYTQERLAILLADSVGKGMAVEDITSLIMQSFDDFTYARARRIAITEASKAWSYAEMTSAEGMESAGFTMVKEWLLGPMHPRYDPCDHNHEQGAIPLKQPFSTGDMAPPQHPHCGCSVITYPDGSVGQPWGTEVGGIPILPPFGGDDQGG